MPYMQCVDRDHADTCRSAMAIGGGAHNIVSERGDLMVLETERLSVRLFSVDDAEFILRLLNEPSFIENIADKGIRTLEDAKSYILSGPMASYDQFGFGLWCVALKDSSVPIGMCGLLKRDFLEDVDIGYAFLPEYCMKGYAFEVSSAVMAYATGQLGLKKIVAIVSKDNTRSIQLLEKMTFRFERTLRLADDDEELLLLAAVGKRLDWVSDCAGSLTNQDSRPFIENFPSLDRKDKQI